MTNDQGNTLNVDTPTGIPILVPIFKQGKLTYKTPNLSQIREHSLKELTLLPDYIDLPDQPYFVGLSPTLHKRKKQMIQFHQTNFT